jgi:hypothetical protein
MNVENFPRVEPSLLTMESELVQRSDLLVVTAQRLCDKWGVFQRPMVLARNAARLRIFCRTLSVE